MRLLGIAAIVFLIAGWAALRPVCVPLSAEQVAQFTTPIEQRTDRDFFYRVFQQRDGQWHQCKAWMSRQLFF